ncbi:Type IV secretion system protein VirD4 [Burkholderia diffusa]|uniref:type IV secretory system conjugative DNA transfer family protein n=1 Tax=Burkholderia diffusa TaxID=488732 RepID=UPI001CB34C65|nr:type IV secretory system conjugative DNA transfer family protein [Burkholderia diffusa]CAG9264332.1 Type IV secretion system protein VirD4 [Burkholderia diffusa]
MVVGIVFGVVALIGLAIAGQYLGANLFGKLQSLPASSLGFWTLHDYWLAYGHVPAVKRALVIATVASALVPLVPIAVVVMAMLTGAKKELYGDARFARPHEIRQYGLLKEAESRGQAQGPDYGPRAPTILLGKYRNRYLTFGGQQFVLVDAETRSGKGVSIVIPNLLTFPGSVAVLDVKDENFQLTSGYRQACGQEVYRWAPYDENGFTHRFNPLEKIAKALPHIRIGMIQMIAARLYSTADAKNKFFYEQARDLFLGLGLYLIETSGTCTFGEILRSATRPDKKVREHLTELTETTVDGNPLSGDCLGALSRVLASPDDTMLNIVATFNAGLTLFSNPYADHATSANDFDLAQVRRRPMSVYLVLPVGKLAIAGLLANLFFNELIECNLDVLPSQDETIQYQCLCLMDESAAIGPLPILSKGVAFIAGYWMRLLSIFQSKSQGEAQDMYGREGMRNFVTNHAVRVVFKKGEGNDAKELSELLGTYTADATSKSRSRGRSPSTGTNTSDHSRALMLAQEVMRMKYSDELIFGFEYPIFCNKAFYYEDPLFVDRLKAVSPLLSELAPGEQTPSEKIMQRVQQSGELAAKGIPTHDVAGWHARLSAKQAGEIRLARQAGAKQLTAAEVNALDAQTPSALAVNKTFEGICTDMREFGVPVRDDVVELLNGWNALIEQVVAKSAPTALAHEPANEVEEAEHHGE